MVTFRFYVVSIVAFFLALAVGVVLGSVLDEGISNSLKDRLEGVERNLDDTVARMDQKNREIEALGDYVDESAPFTVSGRLPNTSTLVVAEEGVSPASVKAAVVRLREAGSSTPGILWLDDSWDLNDSKISRAVARLLDLPSTTSKGVEEMLWERLLSELDQNPSTAPDTSSTTTSSPTSTTEPSRSSSTGSDSTDSTTTELDGQGGSSGTAASTIPINFEAIPLLVALEESSLARYEAVGGKNPVGGSGVNLLVVTGRTSGLKNPGVSALRLATFASGRQIPAVVGEVSDQSSDNEVVYGSILKEVMTDDARALVSTVDNLDQTAGQVAAVLALEQSVDGVRGHYGYGPSVDSILPPWPGP